MELSLVQKIAVFALPVLFAITLHEAAHGYVARFFGDMTADAAGRISLNPVRHIDLLGTIVVPLLTLMLTPVMFGWAKPVPVNFAQLRHPKRDMLWVSAAGPFSNLGMALGWGVLINVAGALPENNPAAAWLMFGGAAGVLVNVIFFALNLFPLPPLDGGRMVTSLLPYRLAARFAAVERYGFIILLALLFTGILGKILTPLVAIMLSAVAAVCGVPEAALYQLINILQ
jgi:Zn-dependent protease